MPETNPVVHFNMPYEDCKRVVTFYSEIFGWQMQPLGPESGGYVWVETRETDENGVPIQSGGIGGGFFPKTPGEFECPAVVIRVKDLSNPMKRVIEGGGAVVTEPMEITGVGMYVDITDTEGNKVGLLQPLEK